MKRHPEKAAEFISDEVKTKWHDESLWLLRTKRDNSAALLPEWEELRQLASDVKDNVLSNLDVYLETFEKNAIANGVKVHWATNAEEHNKIVLSILEENKVSNVVKSKSMLTEECHLNPFLEKNGIQVIDTDLGERIIQMRNEPPSHIVAPAIHLKKEEIGDLFHKKLGSEEGNSDPQYLTEMARQHLRSYFLESTGAITGVNFGIAETGGIVVVTNEGNSDMGANLAKVQIHCMGIEKLIPRQNDLGVFTRLLARSATGQPITIYTSHYHNPRPGTEMHVVLVDNGRSEHLGRDKYRNSLKCIRCGACMNTCPIYRRSGGHSYGSIIPGPIGSILTPGIDTKKYSDLPFASTLCGSCSDVCPVKINIHEQLYRWRQDIYSMGHLPKTKTFPMKIASKVLASPKAYGIAGRLMKWFLKTMPKFLIYNRLNVWGKSRDLPKLPPETFKEWAHKNIPNNEQ